MRKKVYDGYITLYLTLMITVLMGIILTIMETSRKQVIKTEIESVKEIALFSAFGEFHRQLLEQYDLFAIDSGYGGVSNGTDLTSQRIKYYMNSNFSKKGRDITGLVCDEVEITEYCLLSDENGKKVKEGILRYMKDKYGLAKLEEVGESFAFLKETENIDLRGEWEKADREIQEKIETRERERAENEEILIPDNPADHVKKLSMESPFYLALPEGKKISSASVDGVEVFSGRSRKQGTGRVKDDGGNIFSIANRAFLMDYMVEKCGSYSDKKEGAYLVYQQEYLLFGSEKDSENLEKTINRIFAAREGINYAYLMTDVVKKSEAKALASMISTACLMPELEEVLTKVILFAWSYAESIQDIRILLDGNLLPEGKSASTWNVPLSRILSFTSHLDEYRRLQEGVGYKDYVKGLLYLVEEEKILNRFMDICEMDIRKVTGNDKFCVDQCIVELQACSYISSKYGYDYNITRSKAYQ